MSSNFKLSALAGLFLLLFGVSEGMEGATPWTPGEIAYLKRRYNENMAACGKPKANEIAQELNRTYSNVNNKISSLRRAGEIEDPHQPRVARMYYPVQVQFNQQNQSEANPVTMGHMVLQGTQQPVIFVPGLPTQNNSGENAPQNSNR